MPASLGSGDSGWTEPLLPPSMSTTLTQLGLWDVDQSSASFLGLDRHSYLPRDIGPAFQESAFPKVLELGTHPVQVIAGSRVSGQLLKPLANTYQVGIWSRC